jgi:hypothetical protein
MEECAMAVKTRYIAGQKGDNNTTIGGGVETIETFGHDLRGLGSADDVGGPMILTRNITTPYYIPYNYGGSFYTFRFINLDTSGYNPPSESSIRANGTTAIARTTPTSPQFSASTALGELRNDGLPSAIGVQTWRARAKHARQAGDEYLNYQFGWVPLVNDVRNFARTVINHHQLLKDFQAGSGKVTRVGYHFPSVENWTSGSSPTVLVAQSGNSGWSTTVPASWTKQTLQKTWFKGAFTYHIPVGQSAAAKAARFASYANHLYGVRLTPEVLWNLSPWTWALDWFANTGDIIHNISTIGHDGLVLKYGYIMSHTRVCYSIGTPGRYISAYPNYLLSGSTQVVQETKKRFPADPYSGFSVNLGPLSATQTAILAALGLSRRH